MLRTGVLIFASVVTALGAYLCATGRASVGGIQTLVGGLVILVGTLFERWRYHNKGAAGGGDWQVTEERFVDPASGKEMEVLYNPSNGERRYREIG